MAINMGETTPNEMHISEINDFNLVVLNGHNDLGLSLVDYSLSIFLSLDGEICCAMKTVVVKYPFQSLNNFK